jgi:hypothetical protein
MVSVMAAKKPKSKRRSPRPAVKIDPKKHAENVKYGRRYRANRKKVLAQGQWCVLRLPGCTAWATQTDHIDPRGPSTTANLQPCCSNCNQAKRGLLKRGRKPRAGVAGNGSSVSEFPTRYDLGTPCPHRLPDGGWCVGRAFGHWSRWW